MQRTFRGTRNEPSYRFFAAVIAIGISLSMGLWSSTAFAQAYPTKPVKLIVPFVPGGAVDVLGRVVAQKLSEGLGQQVIVENRSGAGGTIGAEAVARSPADGYTLLMGSAGTLAISVTLVKNLPYDPLKDLAPVIHVATVPLVLVVHPSIPAKTVKEFIDFLKTKPDDYSFASPGNGTPQHLSAELFKTMADVKMVHVPYKGSGLAINDLIGGQVPIAFDSLITVLPHIKGGRLRALAQTAGERSSLLPNVPTVGEAGLPGFETSGWYGVVAPGRTPKTVITKLNGLIGKALDTPDLKQRLAEFGSDPVHGSSEQFGAFIKAEIAKWGKVVKESGATVD